MRDSIVVDTVCEFVQVCAWFLIIPVLACFQHVCITCFQAALTYGQITLQEECLTFIENNTEVRV